MAQMGLSENFAEGSCEKALGKKISTLINQTSHTLVECLGNQQLPGERIENNIISTLIYFSKRKQWYIDITPTNRQLIFDQESLAAGVMDRTY